MGLEGVRKCGKAAEQISEMDVVRVDRRTSGYMIKEECQKELIRSRAGQRTWRFEERLERGEELQGNVLKTLRIESL